MPRRNAAFGYVLLLIAGLLAFPSANAQPAGAQETLNRYVSDLQKNPGDNPLREKIIRLAQTMKPGPAIPEKAREHYVMAETFVKTAKDTSGYERAIEQYKAALLTAPWWSDAYRKLAIVQKAAARYDDAIASLNAYLLTQPADARDAQDEIYVLKALKQTAAEKRTSSQAIAAPPPNPFEDLLRKIDGRRYAHRYDPAALSVIDVRGKVLVSGYVYPNGRYWEWDTGGRVEIQGRETTIRLHPSVRTGWAAARTYVLSEDGERITMRSRSNDGSTNEYIYLWQK
jgi:tetratricopeptide (TPR) repeat protein